MSTVYCNQTETNKTFWPIAVIKGDQTLGPIAHRNTLENRFLFFLRTHKHCFIITSLAPVSKSAKFMLVQ